MKKTSDHNKPLSQKKQKFYLLGFVFFASILLSLAGFFYYQSEKKQNNKDKQNKLQAISRLKTNQIVQWHKERLSEVQFFSTNPPYSFYANRIIAGDHEATKLLREALLQIMTFNRYENIFILTQTENVLFSVYPDSGIIETIPHSFIQTAFALSSIQNTDLYFCRTHHRFHLDLIAPVFNAGQKVVAVLLFRVNPHDYLYPLFQEWPTPTSSAESYIVREEKDCVEYISELRHHQMPPSDLKIPKKTTGNNAVNAVKGFEGIAEGNNYMGEKVLSYSAKVPGTSWYLISEMGIAEIYGDLHTKGILIILLSLTSVLFVGIFIIWHYHFRQRNIFRELYSQGEMLYQKQEELRESENKFRAMAENMSDVVWVSDVNLRAIFISPSVEKVFGMPHEKALKLTLEERFPPQSLVKVHEILAKVLKNEQKPLPERTQNLCVEIEHFKADGTLFWAEMSITLLRDPLGNLTGFQGITRDIDLQKKTGMKLIENERQLSSMISNLPGFVYRCNFDKNWTMKFISEGCTKITGYLPDDFIDNKNIAFNDIVVTEYQEPLYRRWETVIAEKGVFEAEYLIITATKESRWVWERGCGVFDQEDNLVYLEGYIEDITERKKSEEALRESERGYRELIDGMNETVWIIDFEGTLLDVNRKAVTDLGYSKEELLSIGLFGIDSSLKKEMIVELAHNMPQDQIQIFETNHRRKSGEIIPVEVYSSLVNYKGQKAILSIARNISERKKAEEQIRKERILLRTLIDHLPDAVYVKDKKGRKLAANVNDLKMMNCPSEEDALGKTDTEIYGKEKGANGYLEDMTVIKNRKPMLNKIDSYIDTEGKVHWRSISKIPLFNNDGNVTGLVGFGRDITQQVHDENVRQILYQIARSSMNTNILEELLFIVRKEISRILDATNFYVALHHPETDTLRREIFINERYDIEEWSTEDTLSGHVLKHGKTLLLKEDEIKRFKRHHDSSEFTPVKCWLGVPILEGERSIGVMVVQSYSDPTAYDITHARLLEMIAHELSIVIERSKMISDLFAAKEKAEESDRLKSAFMANISHEIRTPMNGILGFLELLTEPDLSDDQKEMYLDVMTKSGHRLLDTINDIVEISRIEARQIEVNLSEVSIPETLEFHYHFFKQQADAKGIHLTQEQLHPDLPETILTDKYKLDAILTNLLNNAVKYTRKGGIVFGCVSENDRLIFYIMDTGMGIPPDKLESIFERFIQADITITKPQEGTGLGLAIVKAYVEMLHGSIRVESEIGKGSAFHVSLPVNHT